MTTAAISAGARVLLVHQSRTSPDRQSELSRLEELIRDADTSLAIDRAATLDAALTRLKDHRPDLVLLHAGPPGSAGFDSLTRLQDEDPALPILVLSPHPDTSRAEESVRRGAQDYLVTDEINSGALARAVRNSIERGRAAEERFRSSVADQNRRRLEDLGRLAGGIAHDFNNMLAVMLGFAEMASADLEEDDPRADAILEIQRTGEKAQSLVRRLLAYSRRQDLESRLVDADQVVTDTLTPRLERENRGMELVIQRASAPLPIRAHPVQLEDIINNLVDNAEEALQVSGRVVVQMDPVEIDETNDRHLIPHGEYARIAVIDDGIGIESSQLQHIFEPFYTRKKSGGLGLGLATVYQTAKEAGGFTFVSSRVGEGSTFEVLLPLASGPAAEAWRREDTAELPRGNETVLLVGSNEERRKQLQEMLELLGYGIVVANDVDSAVSVYRHEHRVIDMVVSDADLEDGSGTDLVDALHEHDRRLRIALIGESEKAITDMPLVCAVERPVTLSGLANRVRGLIDLRRRGRPPKPRGLL